MTRKFSVGDRTRVTTPYQREPMRLRVGRVYTVIAVIPATHSRHCWYVLRRKNGAADSPVRSDRLRTLGQYLRRPYANRRAFGD